MEGLLDREILEIIAAEDKSLAQSAREWGVERKALERALEKEGLVPARKQVKEAILGGASKEEVLNLGLLPQERVESYWDLYSSSVSSTTEPLHEKITKRALYSLYVVQDKSAKEIAEMYNYRYPNAVFEALQFYDIPIRPRGCIGAAREQWRKKIMLSR